MEGFMIRGWDLVLSGWRWLYEPQPVSDQPEGLGFHNMRGGIDPENHRFRPRFVRAVDLWKDFKSRHGTLFCPGGAGSTNPGQYAIRQWAWGFRTVRGGIDPWSIRFRIRFVWSCRFMEGFLIRERGVILPGWRWLYVPQVGGFDAVWGTPYGAVSARGITVFVPRILEL